MVFKLLTGIYVSNIACHLVKPTNFVTRGHHLRLYKQHVHYDMRKYLFWKSYLPDYVITSNTVAQCKSYYAVCSEKKHII